MTNTFSKSQNNIIKYFFRILCNIPVIRLDYMNKLGY